jgi:hypothetical protein
MEESFVHENWVRAIVSSKRNPFFRTRFTGIAGRAWLWHDRHTDLAIELPVRFLEECETPFNGHPKARRLNGFCNSDPFSLRIWHLGAR